MQKIKLPKGNKLVIGCLHLPCMHKKYPDFLRRNIDRFDTNTVVLMGDIFDQYNLGRWDKAVDAPNPEVEMDMVLKQTKPLYRALDGLNGYFIRGNHEDRLFTASDSVGMSRRQIRTFKETYEMPEDWKVFDDHEFFDERRNTWYFHGTGRNSTAKSISLQEIEKNTNCNVVFAHAHTAFGVNYKANRHIAIFGTNTGTGLDAKLYAFRYGLTNMKKPIVGLNIISDDNIVTPVRMKL